MNTVWLKIAAIAVVLVVALVVGSRFMSDKSDSTPPPPKEEPKTVYDMAERDKQFLEEPKAAEEAAEVQSPAPQSEPAESAPVAQQPAQQPSAEPTQQTSGIVLPSQITQATTMYFKPMSEIDDIEAQRIMPVATAGRSIGRLPVTHFNLMVQGCRQILDKWPDSWYAFRAKQMLEEMPERFWRNYKVTEAELDVSKFLKPRQGTEPRTVEPIR